MKKLLLLILNLFLSFLMYASINMSQYSEGFSLIVLILIGVGAVVSILFSVRIAIHKVSNQELETLDKRIKIAIILSTYWAIIYTAFTGGSYFLLSISHSYAMYLVRFLIGFTPLFYFLIKDNRIRQSKVKEINNNLREKTTNSTKNLQLFKEKKYQMAYLEIEENNIQNKELWAKAFAQCGGNNEKQKSIYVKLRTNELNRGYKFSSTKFEIKQFIWLIILVVFTAILSVDTSFMYALGIISANVLRDGVILTLLVFAFSYFYKKKKWQGYEFLNMLAYTTIIAGLLYQLVV